MKTLSVIFMSILAGSLLTLGLLWFSPQLGAQADAAVGRSNLAGAAVSGIGTPTPFGGSDELPPPGYSPEKLAPAILPTQIPGETLVYFTTTDSDATATVIFLTNTDSVSHTVALRGYSYNGVLGYSLNIVVGPSSIKRLTSDAIAAAPPPSWATPAPIITNFTDFTYFGSLSLPKGVKAEGYTLFNPGTGTVDPRADQGEIPLRFTTDPATIFLPAVFGQ
jgi:hypothetical protein